MKIFYECIPCILNSFLHLAEKTNIGGNRKEQIFRNLLIYLSQMDYSQSPPVMGKKMQKIIREFSGIADPYYELKKESNLKMLEIYNKFKYKILSSSDQFLTALKLAIAGNIIDFGPNHKIDIEQTIDRILSEPLAIDHSEKLKEDIARANSVLYIGDNAGEIVMDKLLLETIAHPNVYFAVRESAVLNDATKEDAEFVKMQNVAKVITTGDNAPGIIIRDVSDDFMKVYQNADVIISKGQGNFEGLSQEKKNIYFLLIAKCNIIANHLGISKGQAVVL